VSALDGVAVNASSSQHRSVNLTDGEAVIIL
jgi:hypothetical protein